MAGIELLDPLGIVTVVLFLGFCCQCLRFLRIRWQNDEVSNKDGRYSGNSDSVRTGSTNVLTGQYTACESPECVRCHRYREIRANSYDHLCRYADNCSTWDGLDRIKEAVEKPPIGTLDRVEDEEHVRYIQQAPNVLFVTGLKASPWWNNDSFMIENAILESNFGLIKKEFQSVFESYNTNPAGWMKNNTPTGVWSVFHLYNQGRKVMDNCERCPQTTGLIESLSNCMQDCLFGNASFSVIFSETHITGHFGPCNIRIRCHLGLIVPPSCSLTVTDEKRTWEEGKCMFFDDSFHHSAEHSGDQTDGPRAVFMIDLWHPDLTRKERNALSYIF